MVPATRLAASTISSSVRPASLTSWTPERTCSLELAISDLMPLADSLERPASARTSEATTAKPRPASPARAAAEAQILAGIVLAAAELLPEGAILRRAAIAGVAEHRMMLALDLAERIAGDGEEVLVGVEDVAVEGELDHRHRLADRRGLPCHIGFAVLLIGDHRRELDDLDRPAAGIEDRVVARLDPELAAIGGDAQELPGIVLALPQSLPERLVFGALRLVLRHEHAVMAPPHLLQRVADRLQEVLVGIQNGAVELEADHRHGAVQRRHLAFELATRSAARKWIQPHAPCPAFSLRGLPARKNRMDENGLRPAKLKVRAKFNSPPPSRRIRNVLANITEPKKQNRQRGMNTFQSIFNLSRL